MTWGRRDAVALLSLCALAVAVFWRLALTELIIARGDLFLYFYPYRDFASAAVRAGRVPLWNPFLFMGAPFLANSQAGFFYPFNLALAWMPVERMVNASIVFHAALAAMGAYVWGRGGLGLRRSGAWLTGVCYGLGGYFVAQVEHLNQVQVLAWLPWLMWLCGIAVSRWRSTSRRSRRVAAPGAGMALIIAAQFLAGHIQSVYICLVGVAGYALLPVAWDALRWRVKWRELVWPVCVVVGTAALGGLLAAVQLLPTLELSGLSIRSGGLPYREAVSFSLRPGLVGRALLPSWGDPLFPEFVAHIGVVGLGLAVLGALARGRDETLDDRTGANDPLRSDSRERLHRARLGARVLAALGLFLALGGYNPVYFLLVKLVPGFGLFRAPARWLVLYAVGVSGLTGMGLDIVAAWVEQRVAPREHPGTGRRRFPIWAGLLAAAAVLAGMVLLGQLLGGGREPELAPPLGLWSVAGWLVAACAFSVVLYIGLTWRRIPSPAVPAGVLVTMVALELLGASFFLPINRATAPGGLTSLRPAVAHLLGEARETRSGPADRFLSISDIFFDPGDKVEIEIALQPQLPADAVYDYVIATKQKEVLIPNLPLYYRLPAMDGYDGGVLPLRRYVTLERLYMPEEQVAIDGRLRENLKTLPDGRWLSWFNVRFVITDKVRDTWFDDVFYDLQMGAKLGPGDEAGVGDVTPLRATALGVVYRADGAVEGTRLADVDVVFSDGQAISLHVLADAVETGDRVTRLKWEKPATPSAIRARGTWQAGEVSIRGLSLIDERTDAFQPLVLSDQGRYHLVHSGDVKIYENLDVRPRAVFVSQAIFVPDDETALAAMRDPEFDPTAAAVFVDAGALDGSMPNLAEPGLEQIEGAKVELLLYEPEHVVAEVSAPTDGRLLLSDAWYPGWEARVDGEPVAIERANILFRAVAVPQGDHRIEWLYRPASYRVGKAISLCAVGLLTVLLLWAARSKVRPRRRAS